MLERQRIILGSMAVFALFVAGVISLLLQNSVIKADTVTTYATMSQFESDFITTKDGITVAVSAISAGEDCVVPSAGRWRVVVQNDTQKSLRNIALRLQVEGASEGGVQLVDYKPQWFIRSGVSSATLYLGEMSSGQVNTFFLDVIPDGDSVAVAASASDDSGFIYDVWAGQRLSVDKNCAT